MFTSLSDNEPSLREQPVRVYHTVKLNSPSNRMADIYVLWLFQPLPGNYPADQSAAQPASCFHPLWQFVSQACCSATDAVGVRALLCCECSNVNRASCGGLLVVWFGNCGGGVWEYLCVSPQHTHSQTHTHPHKHTPYASIPAFKYSMLEHVYLGVCVCRHHASIQSVTDPWLLSCLNLCALPMLYPH